MPSKHVDHRTSRKRGGAPLDPSNLVAMCVSCHNAKTARHDGGFGNPMRDGPYVPLLRGCDADGIPLDPNSHWRR